MSARRLFLALAALIGVAGCSHTVGLDVRYPEAGANRALLASVASRRVDLKVGDARLDTGRIGTRAEDGKDLVTARPVSDIVRDALVLEIGKNGHVVGAAPADISVAADVEEFWLDTVRGYGRMQFVGKVAIALSVADGRTGTPLVTRRYIGTKRMLVDKPSDDARRDVMDVALARSLHDLATDPALRTAFAGVATTAAPRAPESD